MKFVHPHWLWSIAVLPFIFWLLAYDTRRQRQRFAQFASESLWAVIAPELDFGARLSKARLWCLAMACIFFALARPQWGSHEEVVHVNGLDVMLALDVSNSMETEDVVPSRMQKAKHLIRTLTDQLRGDRVGIAAFAGSAYVACPLTTDLDYVYESAQLLGPKMIANQGTDIGIALDVARKAMERGSEDTSVDANKGTPSRAIILISDGEDHEDEYADAAKKVKEAGIKLYVLGIGTQKGGPIPIRDDTGKVLTYKKDHQGQPVVSTFEPDTLLKVASLAGGKYWNVTSDESEVQQLLGDMGALNRTDYAERRYLVYEERFQVPLALAILLLLLEWGISLRKPSAPAAGGTLLLLVVAFMLTHAPAASAEEKWLGPPASLDSYLENEKGLKAYKDGKIDEARKSFGEAQARDPSRPELEFNQGVVQMQQEDVDGAIQAFQDSARGALNQNDPALAGKSLFNLGSALTKKGDLGKAVESYLGAIQSSIRAKDSKLEADARKNLQLLIEQQKQKQQQQQQQQNQDQDQDQKQQQQQQQQQHQNQKDSNSSPQDKKQNEQPKQYQDNSKERRHSFKSEKLSGEDAERVMQELTNRERELQGHLKKQHAESQNNPKDW